MAALTLAGLIVFSSPQSLAQPTPEPIRFIDLSKFDSDLERALKGSNESITVMFYEKTSPNNMPNRLQKWVTAVEKSGGKINIEPPPD